MLLLTTSFLGYPLPRSHRHGGFEKKMFPSTSYSFLFQIKAVAHIVPTPATGVSKRSVHLMRQVTDRAQHLYVVTYYIIDKCLQHLLLVFRISTVDMNKTRPSVSPCLLFDLLLSRGALLAHASLKTMIQELQIQSWHSSISRDDTYPRLKSRGRNKWANNLAHVPWKNAPDFRKTHKERNSFKNCWWRVQGIFQGALLVRSWNEDEIETQHILSLQKISLISSHHNVHPSSVKCWLKKSALQTSQVKCMSMYNHVSAKWISYEIKGERDILHKTTRNGVKSCNITTVRVDDCSDCTHGNHQRLRTVWHQLTDSSYS